MCPSKPDPNRPEPRPEGEKSKTQIKLEVLELKDLGKELVGLPEKALRKLPLSESFLDAILDARRFSRGALQRQLRYIAGLAPNEDVAAIRKALDELRQPHFRQVREFQQLEQWRDRLLAGDEALLSELAERFAQLDRQHLRQLARNALREREQNKPPKSARALFQYLSELNSSSNQEE
ncbi:MAG TPA: ribosome biogenesis factor YjgA [Gammaproteobacteria bacterium]|nr:ribosome biogenesis factor YjgA [Gammaproteobacteria bacterium]